MSANEADDKAKKAAKKAKLKEEAEQLGISYEELKAQKKEKKSKRKREAEKLEKDNAEYEGGQGRESEMKRMRSYSKDYVEPEPNEAKRRRTRSMDKADENSKIVQEEKAQSPEEWRKTHNITIRGYGAKANDTFPDPFIEFNDAPFNPTIQKTLKSAGFAMPTFIQSQVSLHDIFNYLYQINVINNYLLTSLKGLANCNQRFRYDMHSQNRKWKNLRLSPTIFSSIHPKQRSTW